MTNPLSSDCFQDSLEKLNLSTNFWLNLFNGIADGIFVKHRQHGWIFVNEAFAQLLGRDRLELVGRCELDFLLPEEASFFQEADEEVFFTGKIRESHGFVTDGRGIRRFITTKRSLFVDDNGNRLVVGVVRDVTQSVIEYQQAEAEFIESKQLLQLVIDNIPQMICWKDCNSVFLGCNQAFAKAAGLEHPREIVGKTDYDLAWQKQESDWYRECDRQVISSGLPRLHLVETQHQASGQKVWLDTSKIPLVDRTGNIVGLLAFIEDITQQQINQQYVDVQNAVMQILATTATIEAAAPQIIQVICHSLDWQFGEFWSVDPQTQYLSCLSTWHSLEQQVVDCVERVKKLIFAPGLMLAKIVLSQHITIFETKENTVNQEILDLLEFNNIGEVCSMLAFPIIHGAEIIGVMTLFSFHQQQTTPNFINVFNLIGKILGQFVARKHAENALAASEAKLQKLADSAPGMLYQFQLYPDGVMSFPYVSSGCQEIFGLTPRQIQENPNIINDYVHPDYQQECFDAIIQSAQTLNPWKAQLLIVLPHGEKKWLQGISRPEKLADGSVLWHGIVIDITRLKATEVALQSAYGQMEVLVLERTKELAQSNEQLHLRTQELETALDKLQRTQIQLIQSEKMSSLGQLVAGIAHEINNPINFIYANICYVEEYVNNLLFMTQLYQQYFPIANPVIQEFAESIEFEYIKTDLPKIFASIKNGSERIRQIVLSLRSFSRLDEAKIKPVDIHEGINSTLMILQSRLYEDQDSPIQVIKKYGDLPLVECYAGKINQVFMNIISNAIDALQPKKDNKQISIVTERNTTSILIKIRDNGIGIPEKARSRIFDPFFTTKPVGKGTGLGLSISYQIIVELHQGKLECFSQVGQGTEFHIHIPIKFTNLP